MEDNGLKCEISKMLMFFKIPTNFYGYEFLKEGIYLAVKDKSYISSYTKVLYPAIGEKFGVKGSVVERNIRTAITKAYDAGGLLGFNEVFNELVYDNSYKMTNTEFISMILELIHINLSRKERGIPCMNRHINENYEQEKRELFRRVYQDLYKDEILKDKKKSDFEY